MRVKNHLQEINAQASIQIDMVYTYTHARMCMHTYTHACTQQAYSHHSQQECTSVFNA